MSRLRELFDQHGQSPWLDNLRRGWISSGELQALIDRGVRGITSNPSTGTDDYDEQLSALAGAGRSIEDSYWELVTRDIVDALDLLRPVHEATDGLDGFVSVEVDPSLAADTGGTEAAARHLSRIIDRPNLFVKIPATAEGIPAIRTMIGEGCSVNVTLIFFISRTDTEIDRRLEAVGTPEALALRGRAAVAQGQVAYDLFRRAFSGPRWEALVARGARVQRPLWASTSTKNPAYPDTLYVDALIGPDTVNTLPEATLEAFDEHGTLARTVDADPEGARATLAAVEAAGIDLDDVSRVLEEEGVGAFVKSFDELLDTLGQKSETLT